MPHALVDVDLVLESNSLFHKAGGEASIRKALKHFYDRVFSDVMIGFFFAQKNQEDKELLIQRELELASEILKGPLLYQGHNLSGVHFPLRIFGGQFDRRTQILKECLTQANFPQEVIDAWIQATESMRPLITSNPKSVCKNP